MKGIQAQVSAGSLNTELAGRGVSAAVGTSTIGFSTVGVSAEFATEFAAGGNSVFVRTTLTFGDTTASGRLVETVNRAWFEIIGELKKDPKQAHQIPWRVWEEIVAGYYHRLGFHAQLTPRSADLGRDVVAEGYIEGIGRVRVIDQVKAYAPSHLVTAESVRAMLGIMPQDYATKGIVTTTSDFAPGIRTDPFIAPNIPSRLELVSGTELLSKLQDASQRDGANYASLIRKVKI